MRIVASVLATALVVPAARAQDLVVMRGGESVRGLVLDHINSSEVLRLLTDQGQVPIPARRVSSPPPLAVTIPADS